MPRVTIVMNQNPPPRRLVRTRSVTGCRPAVWREQFGHRTPKGLGGPRLPAGGGEERSGEAEASDSLLRSWGYGPGFRSRAF
jgi:hypothetical protein